MFLVLFCGCIPQSKIIVKGIGTIIIEPDLVEINLTINHIANTTQEAQREVNIKINRVLEIVKEMGIEEKGIRTSSLTFNAAYEHRDGRNNYIGQKSEQSMIIIINGINNDREIFPNFIHKITKIDKLILKNIRFDVKDKSLLFIKSRELAYDKALEKAKQYANLSNLNIKKTINISEVESREYFPIIANRGVAYDDGNYDRVSLFEDVRIPTGEIEVTSQILVEFLLE